MCRKTCSRGLFYWVLMSSFFLSCGGNKEQLSDEVADIVGKHTVHFTAPPRRIPTRSSVDAPLMGNGYTGVAIAGEPEAQTFYLARNDFWRLKSALDESYPCVLGKVELSVPALKGAGYQVEQSLYDAITTGCFTQPGYTVRYKTYVGASDDLLVLELTLEGDTTLQGQVNLSLPGEKEMLNKPPLERVFPDIRKEGQTSEGVYYISRAFEDSVDIQTCAAVAMDVKESRDNTFTLKNGQPVHIVCAFSSNFKSENCQAEVLRTISGCSLKSLEQAEQRHKDWWHTYWEKSYVSIPDSIIEKQYYVSLYGTGSCSRDELFPPSIFGTWITQERPFWNGDYHLNYNHMAPYYALFQANRLEQAVPYIQSMLAQIPRGNYYSEKVTGIPGGILLPVGAGPLGIETTRRSLFMDTYFKGWIDHGEVEDEGFFMGQKSNSAYAVVNMAMYFYHTWDKEIANELYPFVKGVATFWENYLQKEGDRYVIYNDAIHEGTIGTKNPILSLGLVRLVMNTAIDMSDFLQIDMDRQAKWRDVYEHLSDYSYQERNGKTVFRYTENGVDWWGDNTLGIQHIYPAGQIGLASDSSLLQIAHNTITEMQRWIDFNGSNSFFPAAVRIGYDPDSILAHLNEYSRHTYPNGFQFQNPHGIENWSTVPNTINQMLCMGNQNIIRVFAVWPKDKDAKFYHLRTEGAFLVSSELKDGVIPSVTIESEQGRKLCLQNPWPLMNVLVDSNGKQTEMSGKYLEISTTPGTIYRFTPRKEQ